MRRRLIEALTYPRLFVLQEVGLRDCPHDSVFDSSWDRCRNCGLGQECHWLSCLNDFADLSNKPMHTLHASLQYSLKLIEAHIAQLQHDAPSCDCEPCSWSRDAQQLSRTFSREFAWDISLNADARPSPPRAMT